jgi:hypothetical protein
MLRKVINSPASIPSADYLLMIAHKAVNPAPSQETANRCRFDVFVRLKPGIRSTFRNQARTWCYRGDKYTDQEYKMLRNLLSHIKKNLAIYDRIELYDNHKGPEERIILKLTDGTIERNQLKQYELMLLNYPLPEYLKITL